MSQAHGEILSQQEMSQLLDSLEASRREDEARSRLVVGSVGSGLASDSRVQRLFELGLAQFAQELSSRFQTRVKCHVIDWEELETGELEERIIPAEPVLLFELAGVGTPGVLLVSRPTLFAWLSLLFGAKPGSDAELMGKRAYTPVERRMLRRFAESILGPVAERLRELSDRELEIGSIEEAQVLEDWSSSELLLVSVDLQGMGELCRVRMAWPAAALAATDSHEAGLSPAAPRLRKEVLDTPVSLHVEAGSAELLLSHFGRLQPGDVIPIRAREDGFLSVRVSGVPKFNAVRGTVGGRSAIQIVNAVTSAGGDDHE